MSQNLELLLRILAALTIIKTAWEIFLHVHAFNAGWREGRAERGDGE